MDSIDLSQLVYLSILGAALLGYFILQSRGNLSQMLRQMALWGLIFIGVMAAYGLWGDVQREMVPSQAMVSESQIEVPRSNDGHYYLDVKINGKTVEFVVDTGASSVVLTREDARKVGVSLEGLRFNSIANTANGTVRTARITLEDVRLGDFEDKKIPAYVNDGEMFGSLLGMSYLSRFSKIEIAQDRLVLTR
ncbi:MAG: aspartyl protease family protein [Halocynthiibacter sp.]|jgi:aspartyl protease family protein